MASADALFERAAGAVLASAAGDALGSQYEFGEARSDDQPVTFGVGYFGHAPYEWTDDTSMAVPLLQALASGDSLNDPLVLGRIAGTWKAWSRDAKDVGAQTSGVLRLLAEDPTEEEARRASRDLHERHGRSGGNGSLMRTGPVALGYLGDGEEPDLVDAATRIARLTHWEDDNVDASVLWSLAIRHAIRTGELDVHAGLAWVAPDRRDRWAELIGEAERAASHPRDFADQNGWVVRAFQASLAAVVHADSLVDVLERAVRGGNDTDTVAAIAGSLGGALHGAEALPADWTARLHGWPGIRADGLLEATRKVQSWGCDSRAE